MHNIALPNKISFNEGEELNTSQIIIEPCFPGYGVTIGNALRRVMLSSLEGAAVVGVKIEGIDHEFMSTSNIKEDVLEILMNLKKVRLILHSDELVSLKLNVAAKKKVTAGDIEADSNVEIINKDQEIANITDMAGNLKMEIFVKKGLGYETIESREDKRNELGYLEIDSIYSPVLNIGIDIDNVRVGKMTNWDKLILNITTDGTISPEEAFKRANSILIKQFNSLDAEKKEVVKEEKTEEDNKEDIEEEVKDKKDLEEEKPKRGRPKKSE